MEPIESSKMIEKKEQFSEIDQQGSTRELSEERKSSYYPTKPYHYLMAESSSCS